MGISGIITAIVVGAVIGALARLIKPGRQNISILLTIVVGIVAAFIGGFIANALGLGNADGGFSFLTFIIQLVLAVIGVGIVAGASGRRAVR